MNDITYRLTVFPKVIRPNDIRYYIWRYDNGELVFKCRTIFELRIFMNLNCMKIGKSFISRYSVTVKIGYVGFYVRSIQS